MKRGCFLLLTALCLVAPPALANENGVKEGAKQFATDAKKAGKQVGRTARKVGKDIGHGTVRAARTIKREFREDFVDRKDDD